MKENMQVEGSLQDAIDSVLKSLMTNFGPLVFKEPHRFRGAILDEPIDYYAKKIRFLLTLAICEMKVFTRLLVVSIYELVDEMHTEYEINKDAATLVIRAISRLHNIEEKEEKEEKQNIKTEQQINLEQIQTKEEKPKSMKENERVANLYSANISTDKKIVTKTDKKVSKEEPKELKEKVGQQQVQKVTKPKEKELPKPYNAGDIIYFGQYKWRIMKVNPNNTALIITQDIISKMAYHNRQIGITWERSDMRKYLNGSFLGKFNNIEQNAIMSTEIETPFNSKYFTQGGQKTIDKVFLISIEEAKQHFSTDTDRISRFERSATWWWLRSPGVHPDHTAFVYGGGTISLDGEVSVYTYEGNKGMHFVGYRVGGVRPAMVISLNGVTKV